MYSVEMKVSFPSHPNGLWRNVCYTQSTRKSLKLGRMLKLAYPELAFRATDPLTGKSTKITLEDAKKDKDLLETVSGYSYDDGEMEESYVAPQRKHAPRRKQSAGTDKVSRVASRISAKKEQTPTTSRSKHNIASKRQEKPVSVTNQKRKTQPTAKPKRRYVAI